MKKSLLTLSITLSVILIASTAVYAIGTIEPSGNAGDDTQYSLNDIYIKLTNFNVSATEDSGTMTLPGSVIATFRTLSEIYGLLEDEEADLVAGNIADGVTIFGVEGTLVQGVIYPTEWSADNISGIVTWATADTYCAGLNENGHTDWRLPTSIELVNAFLTSNPGNTLGFSAANYWSSTERPDNTARAYMVDFTTTSGNAILNVKTSAARNRCTR